MARQADDFVDFVLDQLTGLSVTTRAMFGGFGLYRDGEFFGIVHKGRLYFRTDAATRARYIERGSDPFRPNPRQTLASYFEVPAEVLEDAELLMAWARAALVARPEKRRK